MTPTREGHLKMTPAERAAFIMAQAACLNAEVAGMVAENTYREMRGETIAFGEDAFQEVIDKSVCNHNAAISFLRD